MWRVGVALVGSILIYIGALLYEDEDKRVQSRLEELWLQLYDKSHVFFALEANLLTRMAGVVSRLFDKIFGPDLVSWQTAGVSVACSLVPFCLFAFMIAGSVTNQLPLSLLILAFVMCLMAVASRVSKASAIATCILPLLFLSGGDIAVPGVVIVFAVGADLAAIALTRKLLRTMGAKEKLTKCILPCTLLMMLLSLITLPLPLGTFAIGGAFGALFSTRSQDPLDKVLHTSFVAALMNLNTSIFLLAILAFVILLSLHHLFWPVLLRPLYLLQQIGFSNYRKRLALAGTVTIAFAVVPSLMSWPALLEALKKALLG